MRSSIIIFLIILIITSGKNQIFGQCNDQFYVETKGFYCEKPGTICIVTVYKDLGCEDYEYQLEFPTTSFFVTNNGDMTGSVNPTTTIYSVEEEATFDITRRKCISGLLQIPNTVFTVRLVNKFDPTDIISTFTFKLDDYKLITGTNTVSSLIASGDLLAQGLPDPGPYSLNTPQKIVIDGHLIVDIDYLFSNSTLNLYNEIILKNSSSIEIQPGIKLNTRRTNIYKCPEYPQWDRIEAMNGSTFDCRTTTISGGQTGVWLKQNSTFNSVDVKLFENFVGLRAYDPLFTPMTANITTPYNPLTGAATSFSENDFGMVLYNASPIVLQFPVFLDNKVGIYPANSSLTATKSSFKRNGYGIQCFYSNPLISIKQSTFDHNSIGIHSIAESLIFNDNTNVQFNDLSMNIFAFNGYNTEIKRNEFTENKQGIVGLTYAASAEISQNILNDVSSPFSLNGIAPGIHDWDYVDNSTADMSLITGIPSTTPNISLNNTNEAEIEKNDDGIWQGTIGVYINGGHDNFVSENNIANDNTHGIGLKVVSSPSFFMNCNHVYAENALNVLNTNATSVIILNSLLGPGYNMQYGTALNTMATSGIQEYRDNRFEASAGFKAKHFGSIGEINNSKYIENNTVGMTPVAIGGIYFPHYEPTSSGWFSVVKDGENPSCIPLPIEPGDSTHFRMANENIGLLNSDIGLVYNAEVEFDTKLKLMRSLRRLNEIGVMTDEQQQWYDELSGTLYGQFINIENLNLQSSSFTEDQQEELKALEDLISEKLTSLDEITWVVYNEETEEFEIDEEAKAQFEVIKEELSQILISKGQILTASKIKLRGILPLLNEINEGITPNGTISSENLQNINRILYNRLISDTLNYTDEEKEKIVQIASQCMGMGGEAVAQARSMRSEFDSKYYEYDDECLVFNELTEQRKRGEEDYSLRIKPNPANETTTLEITSIDEERTIYLVNYMGKIVKTYVLGAKESRKTLNIAELPSGLYYIKIEGLDQNKKLIKIN